MRTRLPEDRSHTWVGTGGDVRGKGGGRLPEDRSNTPHHWEYGGQGAEEEKREGVML